MELNKISGELELFHNFNQHVKWNKEINRFMYFDYTARTLTSLFNKVRELWLKTF